VHSSSSVEDDIETLQFEGGGFKCPGRSLDDDDNVPILRHTHLTFNVFTQ